MRMFDKISFDVQPQIQIVTWRFQKQNWMNVNLHLHFLLKCHLSVTWLIVHVIPISNVSIDMFFPLHKSHYISDSNMTMSIDVHFWRAFLVGASFCVSNVKNLQFFVIFSPQITHSTIGRWKNTLCSNEGPNERAWLMRACHFTMHVVKDSDSWDFILKPRIERERPDFLHMLENAMLLGRWSLNKLNVRHIRNINGTGLHYSQFFIRHCYKYTHSMRRDQRPKSFWSF